MDNKKLTEKDYKEAARKIGCEVAVIKAVAKVESNGGGFNIDRSPKTLFEGHWFYKLSGSTPYSKTHPHLSYKKWTRKHYGKTWREEKARFEEAYCLEPQAAIESASWGMFQIMGFHWKKLGYSSAEDFKSKMYISEGEQLKAFIRFIKMKNLDDELRNKEWAKFAYQYNGREYYKNKYDIKMKKAYKKYKLDNYQSSK